jgi:hypothetical protein
MEEQAVSTRLRASSTFTAPAWSAGARRGLFALLFVLLCASVGLGQSSKKKPNDPSQCPYCENDPELMKAAGIVSHGGFRFGKAPRTTKDTDELLVTAEIRWIETEHFRIGFALGEHTVKFEEKKKILAELTRLQKVLPAVKPNSNPLNAWLRIHLYAQRCEEIYQRFLAITQSAGTTFADGTGVWTGTYRGEGPYLGMKEKFELLILPSEAMHVAWLLEHEGLRIKNTQRWHFFQEGLMTVSIHAQQGNLRQDPALHGHVAFNLAHNLYDALNHYSYDTPIWLHEGLAHFMEREIDPRNNSFDSGEGAVADMTSKANWRPEVLKLIASGEAPRMAELMAVKSYSELKLVHHFVTWSIFDFLQRVRPTETAKFMWALKQNYNAQGIPTGDNLHEWHRTKFKEIFGWSYQEFDDQWRAWALSFYRVAPGKEPPTAEEESSLSTEKPDDGKRKPGGTH